MTPFELAELHAACFRNPRPWSEREIADLLELCGVFLCEVEHGFLMGRQAGPEVEVLTLAVHPEHRRQRAASQLLAELEQTARSAGASEIFLEVAEDNLAAKALYESAGYEKAGYRKDYYLSEGGKSVSALLLTKTLR